MGFVEKEIRRLTGKAIHRQKMIEDGDHILVSVSGGKDSMALLWLLQSRIRRIPISYKLTAVHIDPGFGGNSADALNKFLSEHDFDYRIVKSDIGPKAHGPENGENPCFLCSRLRRKLLFENAKSLGCNRVAMGHHKDDIIETLFLNMFYGASISTMRPVQDLFGGELTIIRPLFLVEEDLLRRYGNKMNWPRVNIECPTAGRSKREAIKTMLNGFYRKNRKIKGNIFHALQNVNTEYLFQTGS